MRRAKSQRGTVFISHSSRDREVVVRLARMLKDHKVDYWFSVHIAGAKQWHDEIGRALDRCDWFLIVLTPNSVRSQWVKRELLFALNEGRYNEKIIPVLRRPCEYARLSWTLPELQLVDFSGSFDVGCRQLLRIWKMDYASARRKAARKIKKTR